MPVITSKRTTSSTSLFALVFITWPEVRRSQPSGDWSLSDVEVCSGHKAWCVLVSCRVFSQRSVAEGFQVPLPTPPDFIVRATTNQPKLFRHCCVFLVSSHLSFIMSFFSSAVSATIGELKIEWLSWWWKWWQVKTRICHIDAWYVVGSVTQTTKMLMNVNLPHTAVTLMSVVEKNIQMQICQLISVCHLYKWAWQNSHKQHLSPFTSFTESVSNKGQTIATWCESNALFTKVGQHSCQENASIVWNCFCLKVCFAAGSWSSWLTCIP